VFHFSPSVAEVISQLLEKSVPKYDSQVSPLSGLNVQRQNSRVVLGRAITGKC
jgi:hypothetical protein